MNPKLSVLLANSKTGIFPDIRNNAIDNCYERLHCYILQLVKTLFRLDIFLLHNA